MTTIRIKAELHPTENAEKVTQAINNIFGNIEIKHDINSDILTASIDETQLAEFRKKIRQDRIRTTINDTLCRWTNEDYLSFGLNRQAAFAGHVSLNLTNEDPMGPIQLQMRGDVQSVIEYLCS